jgi:hypothetical protein
MKRTMERFAALFCALCLLISAARAVSGGEEEELPEAELTFSDVSESDWFYAPVRFLASRGILQGFPDGTFRPGDTLTQAQLLKLMLSPYMPEDTEEPAGSGWWMPYGEFGLREGILSVEDLARLPEPADRLRTAELLARLPLLPVSEEDASVPDRENILAGIADLADIPEDGLEAVVTVYAAGVMQGYEDGCFRPERILTRAEGAAVIQRLLLPELRQPKLRSAMPEDWFSDALLLGNSHCGGLSMFGELPAGDICFSYGGSIFTGLDTVCRDRHERSFTLRSLLSEKQYGKIILIYGTNEMGYDMDYLRPWFKTFLNRLAEAQPAAEFWLCTAPPVNPELNGGELFTVENCCAVNDMIRSVAEERGYGLIDVYAFFADEEGVLPPECTGDGIHLTAECYRLWSRFLTATVLGLEPELPAEEDGTQTEQ